MQNQSRRLRRELSSIFALMTAIVLTVSFVANPAEEQAKDDLFPVRIALQWLPQSQFAGYYMASEQGYYREAGLDVTLLHAGPGPSSLDYLVNDRAEFGTMFLGDAIVHAREPIALAHVAQFAQHSNLMLISWKDMGIETPADLDGKRISYWPGTFSITFTAFFRQHGIQPHILPQHHSVNLFLHRGVAACAAMYYNEYHRIYQAGHDYEQLTLFLMRDYGLGFPEDGLYTRAETAAQHPDVSIALRQATLAGWEYARKHPEEALDAVLRASRQAGVPANRPHSRWMLDHVLASIFPPKADAVPGLLNADRYQQTVQALVEAGLVDDILPLDLFFPIPLQATTP